MPNRTDASVAFSVTDNLSASIVGMKNSVNSFESDITGLQQKLDQLDATRIQLKNFDLKNARQELTRTRQALEELGDAATDAERAAAQADFDQAVQNYANLEHQLNLVSKQARQTEKDMLDATNAISKAENRAGRTGDGSGSLLAALGTAGLGQMAGEAAQEIANTLIGSAFGSEAGGVLSSGLSGAISGAAIGSIIPGIGTAVGAAIGGSLGLLQGGTQAFQSRDEAFKSYYQQLYEASGTAAEESLTSGSATAAQRELDAIAFNRLLGAGVGDQYLADLRTLAADTPLEYSDLTDMSRALATGFGDSPDRMLELMTAIGDAGSAVGVTADDMTEMARALSRMNSSGKATLEYLNILQERGVDVIGMLADSMGKTQGEIYDMISRGEINGQSAVDIIQAGMETRYSGAMETMAETFNGLTSTLEDAMTEIDNARGAGYNTTRSYGLQAEIDAYGGTLGSVMQNLNRIAGENEAYLENLSEQYTREALSAVLLGQDTTLYDGEQQQRLEEMRKEFSEADALYQATGDREAALKMESLQREAETLATAAYESSEQYQLAQDTELDLIEAIRENTEALDGWANAYNLAQAQTKGLGSTWSLGPNTDTSSLMDVVNSDEYQTALAEGRYSDAINMTRGLTGYATGLRRVPYDNYAALLHEGERVLTAREAREADQGSASGVTVQISGTWQVRSEQDADAIAETILRKILLAQKGGVRT